MLAPACVRFPLADEDSMEHLRAQLLLNPYPTSLALDFLGIRDLRVFLPTLARLPLRDLKLNGNALTSLPDDLSSLKDLHSLDLAQNLFRSIRSLTTALRTLPRLEHLCATLTAEEAQHVKQALPNLSTLNGKTIKPIRAAQNQYRVNDAKSSKAAVHDGKNARQISWGKVGSADGLDRHSLSPNDLAEVARLYGSITSFQFARGPETDADPPTANHYQILDEQLQQIVRTLEHKLDTFDSDVERAAEVLMAKHKMFDLCFQESITSLRNSNEGLADTFQLLRSAQATLVQHFRRLTAKGIGGLDDSLTNSRLEKARSEGRALLEAAEALEREKQDAQGRIMELEAELSRLKGAHRDHANENGLPLSSAKSSVQPSCFTSTTHRGQSVLGTVPFESERGFLTNLRMRKADRKYPTKHSSLQQGHVCSVPRSSRAEGLAIEDVGGGIAPPQSRAQLQVHGPPVGDIVERDLKNSVVAPSTVRNLTLHQLKGIVRTLYSSKAKYDSKTKSTREPRVTMEQHLYKFLNQRYGLKNLIVENACAILKAVQRCARLDNEVAVFAKVLRNEVDEDFRFVQMQLVASAQHLLRLQAMKKNPLMREAEVQTLVAEQLKGEEVVNEEDWGAIVSTMYCEDDSRSLRLILKDVSRAFAERENKGKRKDPSKSHPRRREECPVSEGQLLFPDFVKVLLDFQLHGHQRFLAPFRKRFRQFDTDNDGVVNEVAFRAMLAPLSETLPSSQVDSLLENVDPNKHNIITFSDAVGAIGDDLLSFFATEERRD